ncbi:MAG: Gfo/Idh/MocA family oxidoreductase [Clostridia bacterium]|nr:Gfo/Idh/MocA family oxidoreductase [Clostridia bacterium]
MKERVRIGYVGLGRRGKGIVRHFAKMSEVEIVYLCDKSEERLKNGQNTVIEHGGYAPRLTTDYSDIINDPTIDAVVIMIGWSGRPQMAMQAMRAGKYAAVEVGCADTLEECWDLIRTYEETGMPLMMLENCCYDHREMTLLNMVKKGIFGEVVHCTGGYHHNLNEIELFKDLDKEEIPHYRLKQYREKNRENYPTHELGPISKILSVNRGNRMVKLTSVASKAAGLKAYAAEHLGEDSPYATDTYKQGDIVDTIITCANGATIHLTLDTTLPRAYYSRNISVRGTKAMSSEERRVIFTEGMAEPVENNEAEMFEKYEHPLYEEYKHCRVKDAHGGMDWLVCRAFIDAVRREVNTPIDAYDTVTWMAIGPLSAQSIRTGASVDFPDFTNGKWENREAPTEGKYCLDKVCIDHETPIV